MAGPPAMMPRTAQAMAHSTRVNPKAERGMSVFPRWWCPPCARAERGDDRTAVSRRVGKPAPGPGDDRPRLASGVHSAVAHRIPDDAQAAVRPRPGPPRRTASSWFAHQPAGDQPQTIRRPVAGFGAALARQVLLGVTGSGKTTGGEHDRGGAEADPGWRPTRRWRHSCTANSARGSHATRSEYFVSYYDYYQPEAYVPSSDTYIEDSSINDHIEQMRLSATKALLSRRDTIVVARCRRSTARRAEDYLSMRLILSRAASASISASCCAI